MSQVALQKKELPSAHFIWRRIHSLMGFWLVLFLFEHLTVNSQAALWIGDDGHGFIRLVNFLESLPYLQIVEVVLIGIPILVHASWGVKRLFESKSNVIGSAKSPSLPFGRNIAYTLQRLSSWVLLIGLVLHVIDMRFINYPKEAVGNHQTEYMVQIDFDEGLYTLADRLKVNMYSQEMIDRLRQEHENLWVATEFSQETQAVYENEQKKSLQKQWLNTLFSFSLEEGQVVASCPTPGTAMLLTVRNEFKSLWVCAFYTLFVLAAAFHALNGLWTFCITWGFILSYRSQRAMLPFIFIAMTLLGALGLVSIWCSYWVNLRS